MAATIAFLNTALQAFWSVEAFRERLLAAKPDGSGGPFSFEPATAAHATPSSPE